MPLHAAPTFERQPWYIIVICFSYLFLHSSCSGVCRDIATFFPSELFNPQNRWQAAKSFHWTTVFDGKMTGAHILLHLNVNNNIYAHFNVIVNVNNVRALETLTTYTHLTAEKVHTLTKYAHFNVNNVRTLECWPCTHTLMSTTCIHSNVNKLVSDCILTSCRLHKVISGRSNAHRTVNEIWVCDC